MAASESNQKAAMRKIVAAFWVVSQLGLLQPGLRCENRLAQLICMMIADDHALDEIGKAEADFKELGVVGVVVVVADVAVNVGRVFELGDFDFRGGVHGVILSFGVYTMLWGWRRKSRMCYSLISAMYLAPQR
jgi:hypothetical protein